MCLPITEDRSVARLAIKPWSAAGACSIGGCRAMSLRQLTAEAQRNRVIASVARTVKREKDIKGGFNKDRKQAKSL
uniref:Uncharacterized protein n=1 Tax=Heterorhabditis bacteriophora TaxID=37862 RepID=A0A1I7XVN1_HETBA